MAILTYHAAPTARGSGNGSSAANAMELFPSGSLNSILANNDYATNAIVVLCQNTGAYTLSQSIVAAAFTSTPPSSSVFSLSLKAADSDGNVITPDLSWNCAEGPMDTTGFCTINYTLTTVTMNQSVDFGLYGFIINASQTASFVLFNSPHGLISWCQINVTSDHLSAVAVSFGTMSPGTVNCEIVYSGSAFARLLTATSSGPIIRNVRLVGSLAAASGTMYGLGINATQIEFLVDGPVFVKDMNGAGLVNFNTGVSTGVAVCGVTVVDCAVGVQSLCATSGGVGRITVADSIITGCTVGLAQAYGRYVLDNVVLRNTSDFDVASVLPTTSPATIVTAETDEQLYVDSAAGDYRVKTTSAHWGKNRGAGDEVPTAGNDMMAHRHGIYLGSKGAIA